jgi:hypothetical protein
MTVIYESNGSIMKITLKILHNPTLRSLLLFSRFYFIIYCKKRVMSTFHSRFIAVFDCKQYNSDLTLLIYIWCL